jgi:methionyl-tRNA formyltransferase
MRILFAGHKERGERCLEALLGAGHSIVGLIVHPGVERRGGGCPIFAPADVNDPALLQKLSTLGADLIVLAGYGQLVKRGFINLVRYGCINLHGGKLPEYRGSSPMNWALINGEQEFGLSVIQISAGIDTGDVLAEKSFPISIDATIADLHRLANAEFPGLLLDVVRAIGSGTTRPRRQDEERAAYYPLRFPEDGLILWDQLTAVEIHNRIRALTEPYPCAFTYFENRKVKLMRSRLDNQLHYGEPGRVYRKTSRGALVCASDRCLWLEDDALAKIPRYSRFATVRGLAANLLESRSGS